MSANSSIEWTDATWNPLAGCSRVSAGCEHCYAERLVHRGLSPQHEGLTTRGGCRCKNPGNLEADGTCSECGRLFDGDGRVRWTGEVRLVEKALDLPLRWRKPRKVFVNSLSDLFHENVPDEWIDRVFAAIEIATQHTFQILTKRPERMRNYFAAPDVGARVRDQQMRLFSLRNVNGKPPIDETRFPLPNVQIGVSCEDQDAADERIPLLLQTPAAVRFVSAEPLLGPIDFARIDYSAWARAEYVRMGAAEVAASVDAPMLANVLNGEIDDGWDTDTSEKRLDWIIAGGESGPGARPCDVAWIRSIVEQCRAASVPCFVKQLGANPTNPKPATYADIVPKPRDRKGADPSEWPEDLRVQDFPAAMGR